MPRLTASWVPAGLATAGERTMDLHGLHVAEALTQLSKQIGAAQVMPNPPRLTVVTGAGLHTKVCLTTFPCFCFSWGQLGVAVQTAPAGSCQALLCSWQPKHLGLLRISEPAVEC